ncbi:MAG: phosphate acyltransferase PlsX [Kofleriaceae bacterium]|nr:phosphate acyltransferase PlsX [Kofleriaceae bacterium]
MIIAVDAMGGDAAPRPEVSGAVAAVREAALEVVLVGDRARLEDELTRVGARGERGVTIEHAAEVVTMDDHPGEVFRKKRASSLRIATELVQAGRAHALVSAGNSGAILAHALFVLGRLPGVERPAIATAFPAPHGAFTLCDVGANVDVRPTMLAQFALLGAAYDRVVHGRPRPRVGLLANGSEPGKGTGLTRAAHALLTAAAAAPDAAFTFAGHVEGSDLWRGVVDVVATDGFTGNVVLKVCEGVADALFGLVRAELAGAPAGPGAGRPAVGAQVATVRRCLGGAAWRRRPCGPSRSASTSAETGGALLAGVDGVVVIAHGRWRHHRDEPRRQAGPPLRRRRAAGAARRQPRRVRRDGVAGLAGPDRDDATTATRRWHRRVIRFAPRAAFLGRGSVQRHRR